MVGGGGSACTGGTVLSTGSLGLAGGVRGSVGSSGRSPEVLDDSLPKTGLSMPTMFAVLPLTFTGRSTGSWTPLPEITPGESFVTCSAEAPPDLWPEPPLVAQLLPNAGLSRPTTSTLLPHTFTGTATGSWMPLPEPTPGEPATVPSAVESACAAGTMAIAPDAAATAIRVLRVTRFMRFPCLPQMRETRALARNRCNADRRAGLWRIHRSRARTRAGVSIRSRGVTAGIPRNQGR